jgi:hypothetical protein
MATIAEADSLFQTTWMLLEMPSSVVALALLAAEVPFLSARERLANRHAHQIKTFYPPPPPPTLYPLVWVVEPLVYGPIHA